MKYLQVLTFIFTICSSSDLQAQDRNLIRQFQLFHDNDMFKFREITDRYCSFELFVGYQFALREGSNLGKLHRIIRFLPSEKSTLSNDFF